MGVEIARLITDTNAFFLHLPRCGGTWVEEAMQLMELPTKPWLEKLRIRVPRKHALLAHLQREELAGVKYIYSFVRHPTTYYETTWRYLMSTSPKQRRLMLERWDWHPKRSSCEFFKRNFNRWADHMITHQGNWVTRLYEAYLGPPGGEFVNFIGRRENLLNDYCILMNGLGYAEKVKQCRGALGQLGLVNQRRNVPLEWDPQTLQRVSHEERLAIDRFYGGISYIDFKESNKKSTWKPAFVQTF